MTGILAPPIERLERRALGAFRFVSAITGEPIRRPLTVRADGLVLRRNRRGLYVIERARGLAGITESFEFQPDSPAVGSIAFAPRVEDARGRWLPRAWRSTLPFDPRPSAAAEAASLFRPMDVALLPSGTAVVTPAWALVRASLRRQGAPLGGALIEVTAPPTAPGSPPLLGRGMTDWRGRLSGEGLVAIPGLRFLSPTDGSEAEGDQPPVFTRTVSVSLRIVFDTDFAPERDELPDPDRLLAGVGGGLQSITVAEQELASGRTLFLDLTL